MKFTFAPQSRPLSGYTIQRAIDRGAFGEVYYALSDSGKEVALKLLQQNATVELRGVSQCLNLKHPNLVTLFDIRQDDDGDHWIVMEYVGGPSLERVLAEHPQGMPPQQIDDWLSGIAAGIGFLHEQGIVHRDLKPANIYLDGDVVKVGDVGLSKFITASKRSAQTESVGTVYYMAPEVARGKYGHELDLYSLGVIVYEMLCGQVPFDGESTGEILMKHLTEAPDLNRVPACYRPLLSRALAKDPQQRTASAQQLLTEFRAASNPEPMEIPPQSFVKTAGRNGSTVPVDFFSRPHPKTTPAPEADAVRNEKSANRFAKACRSRQQEFQTRWGQPGGCVPWQKFWQNNCGNWPTSSVWPILSPGPGGMPSLLIPMLLLGTFVLLLGGFVLLHVAPWMLIIGIPLLILAGLLLPVYLAGLWGIRFVRQLLAPGLAAVAVPVNAGVAAGAVRQPVAGGGAAHVSPARATPGPVFSRQPATPAASTVRKVGIKTGLADLSGSLVWAALWAPVMTAVVGAMTSLLGGGTLLGVDPGQAGLFAGTVLLASWLILCVSKLRELRGAENSHPRLELAAAGVLTGMGAFWLDQVLMADLAYRNVFEEGLIEEIGSHAMLTDAVQPTLLGYALFFGLLFGLRQWWWQADPLRVKRFRIGALLLSCVVAFCVPALVPFPQEWGICWAAAISAVVQLSAYWVPPSARQGQREVYYGR